MKDAKYWIKKLGLKAHPEGGYFKETYRSASEIKTCCLGSEFKGPRSISTAIYFLLAGIDFSAMHRIRSDEIWHHYIGASLTVHVIDLYGEYGEIILGKDPDRGEFPQVTIPAGVWFGATVNDSSSYVLTGCTVSPGFDFNDFEMGHRERLFELYPQHAAIIQKLTR